MRDPICQARIVEVDERSNGNGVVVDVIVVENRRNCLLDLHRRKTFVVFSGPFGHVQVQLQNVVELVSRVQVSKTLGNSRVLGSRALHPDGRLRSLTSGLDVPVVARVADGPVVDLFVPLSNLLVLFVLLGWNEVVDDQILQLQLVRQLVDRVVHIISLSVEVFVDLSQLSVGLLEPLPNLLKFVFFEIELLVHRSKLHFHNVEVIFFSLELHLNLSLLLSLLDELLLGFLEFLLLRLGNLHRLISDKHLFVHRFKFFNEFLLFLLRLLLLLFLFHQLLDQLLLLLLLEIGLVFNVLAFTLSLESDLFFFTRELLFEPPHSLLINLDNFLLLYDLVVDHAVLLHDLLGVDSRVQSIKLFSQLCDFFLILTQEGVFRVFVDARLVLDVLCAAGISQSVHRFFVVVIRRTNICNHHRLCVATERVLEQASKFRVTVWNISRLGIGKSTDDMAQSRKREIDFGGFLESIACSAGL